MLGDLGDAYTILPQHQNQVLSSSGGWLIRRRRARYWSYCWRNLLTCMNMPSQVDWTVTGISTSQSLFPQRGCVEWLNQWRSESLLPSTLYRQQCLWTAKPLANETITRKWLPTYIQRGTARKSFLHSQSLHTTRHFSYNFIIHNPNNQVFYSRMSAPLAQGHIEQARRVRWPPTVLVQTPLGRMRDCEFQEILFTPLAP